MMKCHYTYDKKAGKVLIPGCWAVTHSNDMRDCTCRDEHPTTSYQFEKQIFNEKLKEKDEYIKELEKEVSSLNRQLKKAYQIK